MPFPVFYFYGKTVVNIMCTSLCEHVLSSLMEAGMELLILIIVMFNFIRNCQTIFQILPFHTASSNIGMFYLLHIFSILGIVFLFQLF